MLFRSQQGDVVSHSKACVGMCCRLYLLLLFPCITSAKGDSLQALGESLFVSGKLLDLEKRVATSKPMFKFLSVENETFKNKVSILTVKAKNDK